MHLSQYISRTFNRLMALLGWLLLAFYLICVVTGALELFIRGNSNGLGLLCLGVLLFYGARLALEPAP